MLDLPYILGLVIFSYVYLFLECSKYLHPTFFSYKKLAITKH